MNIEEEYTKKGLKIMTTNVARSEVQISTITQAGKIAERTA